MIEAATIGLQHKIPENHRLLNRQGCDFVAQCLTVNPDERPSAKALLSHSWIPKNVENSRSQMKQFIADTHSWIWKRTTSS